MLSKRIAPALLGLIKTDQAIGAGHRGFAKMSDDLTMGSTNHLDMDRRYLGQVVTVATHNLQIVKKLLSDPQYFPAQPKTDQDRSADALKTKLLAVVAQQDDAVNLINGAVETDLMGQMQSQHDTQMVNALGNPTAGASPIPTIGPDQYMSVAGLPNNDPNSQYSQKAMNSSSTLKHTVYDALNQGLEVQQRRIASSEYVANAAVVAAVPLCTSASPGPEPSAPEPVATPTPERTPIQLKIPPI
jgi:hypothetical protein